MTALWSQNHWIQSPHITHIFDHKANMYSKPMAITIPRTSVLCHIMQIILSVFYMHVSSTSLTLLVYSTQRFSLKCQSSCATSITMRVVKYVCFLGRQNRRAMHGKCNIKNYVS
jgi:hypothetical protein